MTLRHFPDLAYDKGSEKPYVLQEERVYQLGIQGIRAQISHAELREDGTLVCMRGFRWDLASGAIDTPDMVAASLPHDATCLIYDLIRDISFDVKRAGDRLFRSELKRFGCPAFRRWYAYLAVSAYSYTTARWRKNA